MTLHLVMPLLGMHIMEGFLPFPSALFWMLLALPFVGLGLRSIRKQLADQPSLKLLLAMVGAFAFVLSALKMPSVTGSCSHPTGLGLGAILFGPLPMVVMGTLVLLFQALMLAHGGLTTLGANAFSMAVVGPFVAWGIYRLTTRAGFPMGVCVFFASALANLMTYVTTACQLAFAFPDPAGGVASSLLKFLSIFAVTQIPLSIVEGLLTVIVVNLLIKYSAPELEALGFRVRRETQTA